MFRYLKAAFFVSPRIPGLGAVPVNLLAVLGLAVLGLAQPGLWLIGAGLELGFLLALAGSVRFRKVVDAEHLAEDRIQSQERERALAADLPGDLKARHGRLQETIGRALNRLTEFNSPAVVNAREQVLRQLAWSHLKLLVAQHHLRDTRQNAVATPMGLKPPAAVGENRSADDPESRVKELERELRDPDLPPEIRQAKVQTRDLLLKRVAARVRSVEQLERISAELERIETQVALVFEQAGAPLPEGLDSDLQVAGILLDDTVFGEQSNTVSEIDQAYQRPAVKATA